MRWEEQDQEGTRRGTKVNGGVGQSCLGADRMDTKESWLIWPSWSRMLDLASKGEDGMISKILAD